ncbi:class I SAM-dependent methyltransferase [Myxococcota bacterium]|nr:class I SAM-dependent methyltransferase [Myxococcota bacterium]
MLFLQDPAESKLQRLFQRVVSHLHRLTFSLTFPLYEWLYLLWSCPEMLPSLWRILSFSWGRDPYTAITRMPHDLREHRHPDDLVYGEIILPTFDRILRSLQLGATDRFVDLGCGRGRLVMMAAARGIRAHGIELVPLHLRCAKYAASPYLPLASFEQADILQADLSQATVFWASGTCWSDPLREQIAARIAQLLPNTRVISVSSPLPHPQLETLCTFYGWTTWGRDAFFLQRVLPKPQEALPPASFPSLGT